MDKGYTPARKTSRHRRKPVLAGIFMSLLSFSSAAQAPAKYRSAQSIDVSTFRSLLAPGPNGAQLPVASYLQGAPAGFRYFMIRTPVPAGLDDPYLRIENTRIDSLLIFSVSPNFAKVVYVGGRSVAGGRSLTQPQHTVSLPSTDTSIQYLVAVKALPRGTPLHYRLLDRETLFATQGAFERKMFFYLGLICMSIAVAVAGLFFSRRFEFGLLTLFIICVYWWVLTRYDLLRPYSFMYLSSPLRPGSILSALSASYFFLLLLWQLLRRHFDPPAPLRLLVRVNLLVVPLVALVIFVCARLLSGVQVERILTIAGHGATLYTIAIAATLPLLFARSGRFARTLIAATVLLVLVSLLSLVENTTTAAHDSIETYGVVIGAFVVTTLVTAAMWYRLLDEKEFRETRVHSLEQAHSDTLKKLLSVQDNERRRIAGDLHDNIGPLLAALKINFRRIIQTKNEELQPDLVEKTESIIDDSIAEIRNVAHNLMPKGLSSKGLITTLGEYFEGVGQLYGTRVDFVHNIESIFLPELQINMYRIVCELVLNAARHSKARVISVTIRADDRLISLSVRDDGTGFRPHIGDNGGALGLQNIKNRVAYLKGQYSLKSRPVRGTSIEMEIPLQFHKSGIESF